MHVSRYGPIGVARPTKNMPPPPIPATAQFPLRASHHRAGHLLHRFRGAVPLFGKIRHYLDVGDLAQGWPWPFCDQGIGYGRHVDSN